MNTLCVVPCGSKKIWDKYPDVGPQKAKDVYIGSFATKCREYAKLFYPTSWVTLSAKHEFLFPDDYIPGPYNVSFNDKKTNPITVDELKVQAEKKKLYDFEKIVVLGGKNYTRIVRSVFQDKKILEPLSGCKGIGYMMSKLKKAIEKGFPL